MAGNVVVKINPDRPWIVVSAVENAPCNVAVYYDILPFVSSTSKTLNYVLTESKKNLHARCSRFMILFYQISWLCYELL